MTRSITIKERKSKGKRLKSDLAPLLAACSRLRPCEELAVTLPSGTRKTRGLRLSQFIYRYNVGRKRGRISRWSRGDKLFILKHK